MSAAVPADRLSPRLALDIAGTLNSSAGEVRVAGRISAIAGSRLGLPPSVQRARERHDGRLVLGHDARRGAIEAR